MELSNQERQRVEDLYAKIDHRINMSRYGHKLRKTKYVPSEFTIKKRLYCWFLVNDLDRYLLDDLAFLRDPDGYLKPREEKDFSPPREGEVEAFLDGVFPMELIPEPEPVEPDEDSEEWWPFILENAEHLDHLEGTGFYGWEVDLYEYKGRYFVCHEAGVTEYDNYEKAKAQIREA